MPLTGFEDTYARALYRGAGFEDRHFGAPLIGVINSYSSATPGHAHLRRVGDLVRDAIHAAGYGSGGQFYAEADAVIGMSPKQFRAGGADSRIHYATAACSLGRVLVATTDRGLCAILLGDTEAALQKDLAARFPRASIGKAGASFGTELAAVVRHIDRPRQALALPLDIRGTAFQQRVWSALRDVAPGNTASYADIARRIDAPRAVRAVAQACAANPLAVAIPCHRVVRADGSLAGYRWGIDRKRELLRRESEE